MAGEINWDALPVLAEIYGVENVEILIVQLTTIRDYQRAGAA